MPNTSPPSPPSLAALFDTSSVEALCFADHTVQALLLVSSAIEPGLAQFADTVREQMVHNSGLLFFNGLCPPPFWLQSSRHPGSSWVSRWTPAADGSWLTRDSDLVLNELANTLGLTWSELPALVVTTDLVSGEALCLPTSAERFPGQLRALRELCGTPRTFDELQPQLGDAARRPVDRPRLRDLMRTVDLGLGAWWAERARCELGRPWRDAVDPELRRRLERYRRDFAILVEEQLAQAERQLKVVSAGERSKALEQAGEHLAPLALVGELLGDYRAICLPRGLAPTARRQLETALRVADLLESRRSTLDPGVAATCLFGALETELNHAWFSMLELGYCPLDEVLTRLRTLEEALAGRSLVALREEHVEALSRILARRRAYLEGEPLSIADLRRLIADALNSGLLASLRPVREALLTTSSPCVR